METVTGVGLREMAHIGPLAACRVKNRAEGVVLGARWTKKHVREGWRKDQTGGR